MKALLRTLPFFAVLFLTAICPAADNAPVVLLKLDDLVHHTTNPKAAVSPRWQRVADFLAAENLKANFGIISESLEGDCPAYVKWIQERHASGLIEFWHHGFYNRFPDALKVDGRQAEYIGGTAADQAAMFNKSLALVKEKTGVEMVAFGPHSTAVDAATYEALEGISQIRLVWFYGPPKGVRTSKVVIQRLLELERPLFVPNPEQLKENFEKKRATLPYVAIQGHPNQWDDQRFENFKKTVVYLHDQGCRFVTVSEYLAARETPAKKP